MLDSDGVEVGHKFFFTPFEFYENAEEDMAVALIVGKEDLSY